MVLLLVSSHDRGLAQETHPILDARGQQANRDYSWQVDTLNGGLVLTFTDLVLSGHAGRDLRFQRTYNSKRSADGGNRGQWTFGIAGYVLFITDPPYPFVGADPRFVDVPKLHTADGASVPTTWVVRPSATSLFTINATFGKVQSASFATYHRRVPAPPGLGEPGELLGRLDLPDGSSCYFDDSPAPSVMRVIECRYPSGSKELSFDWTDTELRIVQHGSHMPPKSREVVMTLAEGRWPTAMHYAGRTWEYHYKPGMDPAEPPLLERVRPPAGPEWTYAYDTIELTSMSMPQGGEIRYVYETKDLNRVEYLEGDPPQRLPTFTRVVSRREMRDGIDGQNLLGTWQYGYVIPETGGVQDTIVTGPILEGPGAKRVIYRHGEVAAQSSVFAGTSWGVFRVTTEEWRDGAFVEIEREDHQYTMLRSIQFESSAGVPESPPAYGLGTPELQRRTIRRSGREYITEYEYVSPNIGDFHRPNRIVETGEAVRVTGLTYHQRLYPTIFIGGRTEERVTVDGETFVKSCHYNSFGQCDAQTIYGVTSTFAYDGFGNVSQITDARNNVRKMWYDYGIATRVEAPAYTTERHLYPEGTVEWETAGVNTPQARTTRFEYDELFRVTKVDPPQTRGGRAYIAAVYDDSSRTVTVRRGASTSTTTTDAFGRPVETIDGDGVKTIVRYDPDGRQVFRSYPFSGAAEKGASIEYDALGRVTKVTNPDATFSTRTYGPGTVTLLDENGRSTTQTWEAFGHPDDGRLARLVDANGTAWTYTYNAAGSLRTVAGGGVTRTFAYNARNQLTSETHPESGTTTYTYDPVGNVQTRTDALNQLSTYEYDGGNRLRKITSGAHITEMSYEQGSDNRVWTRVGPVNMTFLYDEAGRPSGHQAIIDGRLFETRFELDASDNVRGVFYPSSRRVGYEYFESSNRIRRVHDLLSGTSYASGFSYHATGAVTEYTAGNGTDFHFTYDPDRYWIRDIRGGPLGLAYHTYDSVGNVREIDDARGSMPWRQTFAYDSLDRLTAASGAYGTMSFAYDADGSMRTAGADTFTVDAATRRMTALNGLPFTYDANGNMRSGPFGAFTYTPHNQLATASVNAAVTSYAYDADERRVMKVEPNATTYYVRDLDGRLLTEVRLEGSAAPKFRDYIYAGSRMLAVVSR